MINVTIDKENDYVAYNDKDHMYWVKGSDFKCISVTTLVGKYCQPFDPEFWSSYKTLERLMGVNFLKIKSELLSKKPKITSEFLKKYNIKLSTFLETKQNILKEWDNNKNNACEIGTKIHAKQEGKAIDCSHEYIKKFYNGGKFMAVTDNRIMPGVTCHYPELLLHYISPDKKLGIAGQADLVLIDKDMNVNIIDYKTNGKIDKNSYFNKITKKHQMMQYPLSHIQDSNYWHYALQLSVYGWMIKQIYPEAKIKDMRLIHIDRNTEKVLQEYEVPYLEKEVISMLKDYKIKNTTKTAYDKIKPIEY